ncbi:MAG: hypothetical protein FJ395_01410 [Verrucomicrobia bacterium]|nr:hypothetical protein [Verrucomicrobiota bacterium]
MKAIRYILCGIFAILTLIMLVDWIAEGKPREIPYRVAILTVLGNLSWLSFPNRKGSMPLGLLWGEFVLAGLYIVVAGIRLHAVASPEFQRSHLFTQDTEMWYAQQDLHMATTALVVFGVVLLARKIESRNQTTK